MITTHKADVVVVGAGPAGIAAAVTAAGHGAGVCLVDEATHAGGPIWRGGEKSPTGSADQWLTKLQRSSVQHLVGVRVVGHDRPGVLQAVADESPSLICYEKLILAPGARELFLPFPGWTVPNVMGAGGLQQLVKSGLSVRNKRVVVAGTGPLLLASAAFLQSAGARVVTVAEQASRLQLVRFAISLVSSPHLLAQAVTLRSQLRDVPIRTGCWPTQAHGHEHLTAVTLTDGNETWVEPCDYLACGFHLVPNLELPRLLDCTVEHGCVRVDDAQQTTVQSVYAAGEITGIGGVSLALLEGQIAGHNAAGQSRSAHSLLGSKRRAKRYANRMGEAFKLRPELRRLARPDTIVCRCEDVPYSALTSRISSRDAKLQTRCGMGTCQGRICGPALECLFGWTDASVRPPLHPVSVGDLVDVSSEVK